MFTNVPTRTAVAYCIHNDVDYLRSSLDSVALVSHYNVQEPSDLEDVFVFVSRLPWHTAPGEWEAAAATAEALGASVVPGNWPTKPAQRKGALLREPDGKMTLNWQ